MSIADQAQDRADTTSKVLDILRAHPARNYTARQLWALTPGLPLADVNRALTTLTHNGHADMTRDRTPARNRRYQATGR